MKNKNKLKISIFSALLFSLLTISGNMVMASEVTGNLSTGISSTVGTTVDGVVISPPVASPVAGAYTSAQSVTLVASGSTGIHYTVDGTLPTCTTGIVYSGTIVVNSSMAIQAISCYPSNKTSTVASHLYAINIPTSGGGGGGGGSGSSGGSSINISVLGKVDANKDGKVDVLDFVNLMANWGKTGLANTADFNSDGKVDILDFVTLMANWTK